MSKSTRIAIILDRSSSMSSIRSEAISAFNQQVETIKANSQEVDTKVSLFTFATKADAPLIWNQSPTTLNALTEDTYVPDGMTAMYDSVGMAVNLLSGLPEAEQKDTSFLVVIISDGAENNSKQFTSEKIASLVKTLQGTERWTFTYLGANQDLTKVQQTLGIHAGNTMQFTASAAGMNQASVANSAGTERYMAARAGGQSCITNFYNSDGPVKTTTTTGK